jgi:carbon monoxide dehydrogenase subunit G
MKVSGTATLHAPAERVFAALNDPSVLVRTIPGCEQLEALGGDRFRMTITAGVASIKGTYLGHVTLADPIPPSAFTLRANGSGAPGTVTADVRVTLDDNGDGTTLLRYDTDAVVGGPVGGVGQRVLTGVARKTAGEFFDAVNAWLTAPVMPIPPGAPELAQGVPGTGLPHQGVPDTTGLPHQGVPDTTGLPHQGVPVPTEHAGVVTPAPVRAGVPAPAPGEVFRRPPGGARPPVQVNLRDQLPGVLIGALVALLGVIVGWRLGRAASGPARSGNEGDPGQEG